MFYFIYNTFKLKRYGFRGINMTKKIAIVGSPHSGKSMLSQQVNLNLKILGYSSIYIEEYAVDYIAKCGAPKIFEHQMVIYEEQLKKECKFNGLKDFIVCDSASWTSYIYGRSLVGPKLTQNDIVAINQLHNKIIENIDFWDYTFYLPIIKDYKFDGIRYQDKKESEQIGNRIKSWLEIENIPFYDLSSVSLDNRLQYVIEKITK